MNKFLNFCILFSLVSVAFAEYAETIEPLGFSTDGRLFSYKTTANASFSESGIKSGLFVIDVEKNSWVSNEKKLKKKHLLYKVYSRVETDFSSSTVLFTNGGGNTVERMAGPGVFLYELVLKQDSKKCAGIHLDLYTKRDFNVANDVKFLKNGLKQFYSKTEKKVKNQGFGTIEKITLQEDKNVIPKSRGCPIYYRVESVYIYPKSGPNGSPYLTQLEGSIAVLIQYLEASTHGPNVRYLVVTGKI
jgi:predicted secreted protein